MAALDRPDSQEISTAQQGGCNGYAQT